MTWGEVKLATLQKMFSAESLTINENDESIRTYIYAMPQAANEGLQLLSTAGKFLRKHAEFEEGKHDLKEELPDFYDTGMFEVYYEDMSPCYDAKLVAGQFLVAPAKITFFYNAWPPTITSATEDTLELPLDPEVVVLLPLYMASQLYKDDDISISTVYRNEFEAARELLTNRDGGVFTGDFTSVTGWW